VTGAALLAAAVLAFASARRAAGHDRRLNPRVRGHRTSLFIPLLVALGRRPAALLVARIPWLEHGSALVPAAASGVAAEDEPALRAGSVLAFAALAAAVPAFVGGPPGVVAALALAGFGAAFPDLWLRSAAARRAERIERRVPELVELVASMVAAGAGLDAALHGAGEAVGAELGDEVALAQANLALGRSRADELRDLAGRTGSESLGQLALSLRLSDRLGVPLAETLRRQAERARARRARAVAERAARAGPRVLLVVVFVLVPAALLPLAAAVALTVSGSFTGL
jgi:tight adherence protein C